MLALDIPFCNFFFHKNVIDEICNDYASDKKDADCTKRVIKKWRLLLALIIAYSLYCIFIFYTPASVNDVIKGIYYKIFLLILSIHFSFITMEIVELINELERKKRLTLLTNIAWSVYSWDDDNIFLFIKNTTLLLLSLY